MPYKIEITGDDIPQLWGGFANLLMLMAQGANTVFKGQVAPPPANESQPNVNISQQGTTGGERVEGASNESNVEAGPNPKVAPLPATAEKRKPGRPPKPAPVIEAVPADEDPLGLAETVTAKVYTLKEDIQPRVRAIGESFKERAPPAADAKAVQKAAVNYILQLFGKYGMKTSNDLKPEQYAAFMADSEAYLAGTAPVVS